MKNAYWKDIWRTIRRGKKRFISMAMIAALGVTMMCGLRAACEDLRYSADQFFDEQQLFDIRVFSTLGLTDEDIDALMDIEGVRLAEGGYSEFVYTKVENLKKSIEIRTLSTNEINQPYLIEGRMPKKTNEIVVTENYLNHSGKSIGDKITLTEESEHFKSQSYTITGTIIDSLDINSTEGSMGFRSTATTDYVGYVVTGAADNDIYTVIYLQLKDLKDLNCYTSEYTEAVEYITDLIESEIKEDRELARYNQIYTEAMDEWLDGEQEMLKEFAKADEEIADAKQKLADARQELTDGKQELADGEAELNSQEAKAEAEFANARKKIHQGYAEIASSENELKSAYAELTEGQKQLDVAKAELKAQEESANQQFETAWQQMAASEAELEDGYAQYELGVSEFEVTKAQLQQQIDALQLALTNPELSEEERASIEANLVQLEAGLVKGEQQLQAVYAQLEEGRQQLEAGKAELTAQEESARAQIADGWKTIEEKQVQIDSGLSQYQSGVSQLASAKQQLAAGTSELNTQEASAKAQIADGRRELEAGRQELLDGEKELTDGEQELAENIAEYGEEKAKAEKELADAKEEIEEIDMATWYVQDRTSLSSFSNVKSDADSIQAIGKVFPVLFLTVAILISLTTITRMVEEERGLIGTYKALGFTNDEICRKYLLYAAVACLIGGLIGDIGGYIILPLIIFIVFHEMYVLPGYAFQFDILYGLGGILLFEAGIVCATAVACSKALRQTPAKLMRPKAPKSGSRVLLERIRFIWKRMSFLNKVTARNLFRYKKRLFMTVFGIAGCTALLLCGFTIKDSVTEMMPQQYQEIYQYDLMVVTSADDYEDMKQIFDEDEEIKDYIPTVIQSVELINDTGKEETVQLIAIPEEESLETYINLKSKDGQKYELEDGDIMLTRNATRVLKLERGDCVKMQTLEMEEAEFEITEIVENYFGNIVYMTENTYIELFGKFEENSALVHFSELCEDQKEYTDDLARNESILSATSTQAMRDEFSSAFALINMVVYVILVLAAMLAFVVLFTLSNTNISERERELATIKVLGFYDHEVHSYVNKETWILTGIGILAGMPAGWGLGRYVMGILEFSSLEFYIDLYPQSYLYAGAVTLIFAFIVNFITNKVLNRINMVEALKSVE